MHDFSFRFETISHACAASLTWLVGDGSVDPEADSVSGIDLGNGTEISAPDVVESHFERLVTVSTNPDACTHIGIDVPAEIVDLQAMPRDESSSMQADSNHAATSLKKAIGTLAPHLLPLVQVAEELADANPPVLPPKEFRALLNEALRAEHKQRINRQAIGIQPVDTDGDILEKIAENRYTLFASLPVALTLVFCLWYMRRPSSENNIDAPEEAL